MGNCVSCKIKIQNDTYPYFLNPVDKSFIWGRMADETSTLDVILPRHSSTRGVQGRVDSLSGVEGSFTYDVIHRSHNVTIGRIKLKFDVPYDSNRYSRTTACEITHICGKDYIRVERKTNWGGYGHGENSCEFIISVSGDKVQKEEVKQCVERNKRLHDEF